MKRLAMILSFCCFGANAQQVSDCYDGTTPAYPLHAAAIAEPWQDNTRTFADGQVRITIMDTWEPALGAFYLMVLYWPTGEGELRSCKLISNGVIGFPEMTLEGMKASYDPGRGLLFAIPTKFYDPETGGFREEAIGVVINRAQDQVTAERL